MIKRLYKIIKNVTKLISVSLVTFLLLMQGCYSTTRQPKKLKTKTTVTFSIPIIHQDGQSEIVTDSFSVLKHNEYLLYELPYTRSVENETELLSVTVKFNYLLHKKGERYGFFFDSLSSNKPRKTLVDSILSSKIFYSFEFYNNKNDSLVETCKIENESVVEKYIPKIKYDQSYPDTTYFYYTDKQLNIDYSFSSELENAKKKKIFKVEMFYKSQSYEGFNFKAPERIFSFNLKEVIINNESEILDFFLRTKKQFSK
jgi:hypothetical protein